MLFYWHLCLIRSLNLYDDAIFDSSSIIVLMSNVAKKDVTLYSLYSVIFFLCLATNRQSLETILSYHFC